MIKKELEKAFNEQLQREIFSSYLYLAMAAYCEKLGLKGFATWFRAQTQEEMVHAMKFYQYILERGGDVELESIEKPQKEWVSIQEVLEAVYKHECYITENINKLMDLAIELNDHAAKSFLNWFIDEQVEEEDSALDMLEKVKFVGNDKRGILFLDQNAGARAFTPPADFNF